MLQHLIYCQPDGLFYDKPAVSEDSATDAFGEAFATVPEHWRRE